MLAEHNNEVLNPITANTVTAAKRCGAGDITVLVAGTKCGPVSLTFDLLHKWNVTYMCYFTGIGSSCQIGRCLKSFGR